MTKPKLCCLYCKRMDICRALHAILGITSVIEPVRLNGLGSHEFLMEIFYTIAKNCKYYKSIDDK